MKKILPLLCCLCLIFNTSDATHLMGGEITARQLTGFDYEISIRLYRDTTGISISSIQTFDIVNINTSFQQSLTASHGGANHLFHGVEMYEYLVNFTFPGNGTYRISWEQCCRNEAILNIDSPSSKFLHLMTELTIGVSANSTPVFLNPPAVLAQKNSPWQYNPLPFDADGDSLSWLLETPLNQGGVPVGGYTIPHADPLNPFTLNSLNGEITWLPDSNGHWESSFRVEEFRGGIKIGEIRRDMQIIVVDDTSNYFRAAVNNGSWPQDGSGNFAMTIAPGVPFNFFVDANDSDLDMLSMDVMGEPLLITSNPASWLTSSSTPGYVAGTFSWTPQLAQVRPQPYLLAFRLFEHHSQYELTTDETMMLFVSQSTSIPSEDESSGLSLFPNPAQGSFNLSLQLKQSAEIQIDVRNILAKDCVVNYFGSFPAGRNVARVNTANLSPGSYLVTITIDGAQSYTKRLMIK